MREWIVCSATWFDDGKMHQGQPHNITTGKVYCGINHAHIFSLIGGTVRSRRQSGIKAEIQGFITNENRFVTRHEAGFIAYHAGQTRGQMRTLYSEHLLQEMTVRFSGTHIPAGYSMKEAKREIISDALTRWQGNVRQTARDLKIGIMTIYRMIDSDKKNMK